MGKGNELAQGHSDWAALNPGSLWLLDRLTPFFHFLVIAARPFTIPYLTALLPSELEIQQMEETDSSEQDEQTDTENIALHSSMVGSPLCLPHSARPLPLGTEQGRLQSLAVC